ncbi:MAG TPA: PASTA domain-containing protein, partial [Candidatus Limnocylindria bacterium]|nr:PASTA domain-containing protein [Candidatus Limnocylindria bacterium]
PKTKIKPHQTIFLVTSVQQKQMRAPQLSGLMADALAASLKTLGIRPNLYYIPNNHPKDYCIAQFPEADQPLKGSTMVVYISSGTTKPVLLPNFKGELVCDVQDFLHTHQLQTIITHTQPQEPDHTCSTRCRVRDQRPLAGSLLNLDQQKPLTIHVQVE